MKKTNEDVIENTKESKKSKIKGIATATGAVLITGAVVFAIAMAPGFVNARSEQANANKIAEFYLDGHNGVTIGEYVAPVESMEDTNLNYNAPTVRSDSDQRICSGDQMLNAIEDRGLQYVCIDGVYYTRDGESLAAVTYKCTRITEEQPKVVNVNGTDLTLTPRGSYDEATGKYLNYETEYVTRIVKGLDDEEYYMGQKPAGYDEVTIESIEKFDTVALEGDIIADVADSDLGNSEDSQTEIKVSAHQDDQSFYGKVNSFFKGKSR